MQAQMLPKDYQHISPAGAEVRVLIENKMAGMAHCTLPKGKISKPIHHKTVSELWHVIAGQGEIWRKQGDKEVITSLEAGMTVDLPLGTHFQYRSTSEDLVFICITTPLWSGPDEAVYIERGAWKPSE